MQTVFSIKSKLWNRFILGLGIVGIILIIIDHFFSVNILVSIGVICFSLAGMFIGMEAVVNRKIVLQSPYNRRLSQTYIGIAAIAQGLLIILLSGFLIMLLLIDYYNAGDTLFKHFFNHPGIPFIVFSVFCFLTVISVGIGSEEEKQGIKFVVILNLITNRILGPSILVIIGLIFLILGILEIINPSYFDTLGGGFLEVIFLGTSN